MERDEKPEIEQNMTSYIDHLQEKIDAFKAKNSKICKNFSFCGLMVFRIGEQVQTARYFGLQDDNSHHEKATRTTDFLWWLERF